MNNEPGDAFGARWRRERAAIYARRRVIYNSLHSADGGVVGVSLDEKKRGGEVNAYEKGISTVSAP